MSVNSFHLAVCVPKHLTIANYHCFLVLPYGCKNTELHIYMNFFFLCLPTRHCRNEAFTFLFTLKLCRRRETAQTHSVNKWVRETKSQFLHCSSYFRVITTVTHGGVLGSPSGLMCEINFSELWFKIGLQQKLLQK